MFVVSTECRVYSAGNVPSLLQAPNASSTQATFFLLVRDPLQTADQITVVVVEDSIHDCVGLSLRKYVSVVFHTIHGGGGSTPREEFLEIFIERIRINIADLAILTSAADTHETISPPVQHMRPHAYLGV